MEKVSNPTDDEGAERLYDIERELADSSPHAASVRTGGLAPTSGVPSHQTVSRVAPRELARRRARQPARTPRCQHQPELLNDTRNTMDRPTFLSWTGAGLALSLLPSLTAPARHRPSRRRPSSRPHPMSGMRRLGRARSHAAKCGGKCANCRSN